MALGGEGALEPGAQGRGGGREEALGKADWSRPEEPWPRPSSPGRRERDGERRWNVTSSALGEV